MNHLDMAHIFALFLTGLCFQSTWAADFWSYDGASGPSNWGKDNPDCNGNAQSPINIYEGDAVAKGVKEAISYKNYDTAEGLTMTLSNNGHGFVVSLNGTNLPEISGGGLGDVYQAAQFHFHWSGDEKQGSEHRISSEGFPSELHIVHFNKKYGDISTAKTKSDGLAVLGFMLEFSDAPNTNYDSILSALESVQTQGSQPVQLMAQSLNSYLPKSFSKFFRYYGSLTTPPCYETVTWTVFKETIKISRSQLAVFLDLMDGQRLYVLNNVRPLQPINGREILSSFDSTIKWGYYPGNFDPPHWQDYYEKCGGQSQSPVNIPSTASTKDGTLEAFTFNGFGETAGIDMLLTNNGHTIHVGLEGTNKPFVTQGSLPEQYNVAQFHFHWGANSQRGSEHTVDAMSYPMEVHIVMFKNSLGSLGSAAKQPEGLAVLGFFFEVSSNDNPALNPILDALPSVRNAYENTTISTISLDSFIPADRTKYYRYPGSLTTPGCYESVIWTVFESKIQISEAQLAKLRALKSSETDARTNAKLPLVDNYRPVQNLNSRVIRRNFDVAPKPMAVWTYFGERGAQKWTQYFSQCSSTVRQSPIDIQPDTTQFMQMPPFELKNFNTKKDVTLQLRNNGHSVTVDYLSGDLQVSQGGLEDKYKVAQYHFHWGSVNRQGSEHTIGGDMYPMELHIVTYNTKYADIGLAMTQGNGLAVLGFMFKISDKDNDALEPLVAHLSKVTKPKSKVSIPTFTLSSMLPSDMKDFFRYEGSLTTPTCDESVTWSVFYSKIPISQKQLDEFRFLESVEVDAYNNTMPMVDNFRPVQPLGDRKVYSNFYISSAPITAHTVPVIASVVFTLGRLVWSSQ